MLVLDTDVVSLIQGGRGPEVGRLRDRIRASGLPDALTIVTVQEQLRGRIAQCARANDPDKYVTAARLLRTTLEDIQDRTILDFEDAAASEFKRLKRLKIRIGTMDLRIASIVLVHDATLISRNLRDFEKVPGLRVEDWTI